jgi:hypothetical protein
MVGQRGRDHTNGPAPGREDRISYYSHEADRCTPIDESYAAIGQPGAESAGCSSEQGAIPEARAAEDGNITER